MLNACLICLLTFAQSPATQSPAVERPTVLVVVGAPGTEEYGKQFRAWAERWKSAAGRGNAEFTSIGLDEVSEDGADDDRASVDDRDALKREVTALGKQAGGQVWLVLIGHGTFDGKTAKFNLRGPDVSAAELSGWLAGVERPLAVIDATSASGPFINELSAPGRVIVTATKSGFEHNFARFGDYLSAAVADPQADLDKDNQTSLLEAFLFASSGVKEYYESQGRLATEHALIDDNGDRLATPADWFHGLRAMKAAKDGAQLDGLLASQFQLVKSEGERRLSPAARRRRDELEAEIAQLRLQKQKLAEDDYYRRLEPLVVEIARLYEDE
ncbi:MAG TPA: hypothetical protein VFI31_23490 [Pirellulales bacterium]|nr:hypothetical protein [Pirellulales bacterium]